MTDERSPPGLSGAYVTLDTLAELLACRLHVWAQSLAPKSTGRLPKDLRDALALAAAFEAVKWDWIDTKVRLTRVGARLNEI